MTPKLIENLEKDKESPLTSILFRFNTHFFNNTRQVTIILIIFIFRKKKQYQQDQIPFIHPFVFVYNINNFYNTKGKKKIYDRNYLIKSSITIHEPI